MRARFLRIFIFALAFVVMLTSVGERYLWTDEPPPKSEEKTAEPEEYAPKTKEERLRELRLQEAEITLRQREVSMNEKIDDYNNMKALFDKKLVSVQELNDAKKDKEEATLAYEQAKLNMQMWELESLKAAWHITISKAEVIDQGDRKYMIITLENTSEKVKLERTQKMIEEKIIDPVDTEVSPEINDIYVSIKEGDSIISDPYEIRIDSLKVGEPRELPFELIKDVEDVVVSMKYEEQEEMRNIHLRKVEPYISVVKAIKYMTEDDKRMIYVVLRNGAVEQTGEHVPVEGGSAGSVVASNPGGESSITDIELPGYTEAEIHAVNDISNIYVSIRDEERNIIGLPYEIRIPILKYDEQKGYRFEIQKDVNSVIVSLNYLKKEHEKTIYLEPDTRHISIRSAQVRTIPDRPDISPERRGKKEVTLELVNRSESGIIPFAEELEEIDGSSVAATVDIRNVFVSLQHNSVVIAQPYEEVIRRLEYEKPKKLTFVLQDPEINEVTVSLAYLGRTEERNVHLEKVSPPDVVTVTSGIFAQQGELGTYVEYSITLERLAEEERIFKLRVINLLEQFTNWFYDRQGGRGDTRVTQVKFTYGQPKRELALRVHLPEEMDLSLLDKPQGFYAAVLSEEEDAKYEAGRLNLGQDEIDQLKGGKVYLELTPKGRAEFELIAQNLYFPIKTDEIVETLVTLKNTGTRNLDNIRITMDLPSNKWKAEIQPELVQRLDRKEEKEIQIKIIPPPDVGVGASELKLEAECEVDNVKVEASPKNITVHISSRANILGTGILIGALILLVIGIAVLTIRLSRR